MCKAHEATLLYTAAADGTVVKWDASGVHEGKVAPTDSYSDHVQAAVSIDANDELDMVVSVSLDPSVAVRQISSGKLISRFKIKVKSIHSGYAPFLVRLSSRGYIIIVERCYDGIMPHTDRLLVYGINGDCIKTLDSKDYIYSLMVVPDNGYQFLVAGKAGQLLVYDLLSLASSPLDVHPAAVPIKAPIHFLTLVKCDKAPAVNVFSYTRFVS